MDGDDPITENMSKVGGIAGIICGALFGFILPGISTDERALHAVVGAFIGLLVGSIGGTILGKVVQTTREDWISIIALAVLVAIILFTIYKMIVP
jgi:hypothetical protein